MKFSAPLAHMITAGADFLMVPSRFEPCGLIQLHAMQYGTVPVVASTGVSSLLPLFAFCLLCAVCAASSSCTLCSMAPCPCLPPLVRVFMFDSFASLLFVRQVRCFARYATGTVAAAATMIACQRFPLQRTCACMLLSGTATCGALHQRTRAAAQTCPVML